MQALYLGRSGEDRKRIAERGLSDRCERIREREFLQGFAVIESRVLNGPERIRELDLPQGQLILQEDHVICESAVSDGLGSVYDPVAGPFRVRILDQRLAVRRIQDAVRRLIVCVAFLDHDLFETAAVAERDRPDLHDGRRELHGSEFAPAEGRISYCLDALRDLQRLRAAKRHRAAADLLEPLGETDLLHIRKRVVSDLFDSVRQNDRIHHSRFVVPSVPVDPERVVRHDSHRLSGNALRDLDLFVGPVVFVNFRVVVEDRVPDHTVLRRDLHDLLLVPDRQVRQLRGVDPVMNVPDHYLTGVFEIEF